MQAERNDAASPRRVKVKGEKGIYRNPSARSTPYECDYYDSDGRRRWKGGFRTIKDAVAARAELSVRVRRGERVVPSKEKLADYAPKWLAAQKHLRPRTLERYEINT